MTDNDFRSAWLAMQSRIDNLEKQCGQNREKEMNYNRKTSLDSLADRYRRFAILGIAMTLCCSGLFNHVVPFGAYRFTPYIMAAYFLLASVMDWYLMKGIKSIDVNTMSVNKVCSMVKHYKKRHHQFMIVLIPICITILTLFICAFASDRYMVGGVICGAILGLIVGLSQYNKFMSDYRTIEKGCDNQ